MTFGENLRKIRKEKGISQRILGERLNVKQQTIAQYERELSEPRLDTVRRIATALGVCMSDLIDNWGEYTSNEIKADFDVANSTLHNNANSEKPLLERYRKLNEPGRKKATDYVDDLMQIPKYRKEEDTETDEAPEQDPTHRPAQN